MRPATEYYPSQGHGKRRENRRKIELPSLCVPNIMLHASPTTHSLFVSARYSSHDYNVNMTNLTMLIVRCPSLPIHYLPRSRLHRSYRLPIPSAPVLERKNRAPLPVISCPRPFDPDIA